MYVIAVRSTHRFEQRVHVDTMKFREGALIQFEKGHEGRAQTSRRSLPARGSNLGEYSNCKVPWLAGHEVQEHTLVELDNCRPFCGGSEAGLQ